MKSAIFVLSLGEILSSVYEIFKSRFDGNQCQKQEIICAVSLGTSDILAKVHLSDTSTSDKSLRMENKELYT